MSFFESIFLSLFDVIQYYLISNKIYHKKVVFEKWHVGVAFICTIFIAGTSFFIDDGYAYFINSIILAIMNWSFYRLKFVKLIYSHLLTVLLVLTVQLITFVPLNIFIKDIQYDFTTGFLAQTISLAIIFFSIKFFPIHLLFNYIKSRNQVFMALSLNAFICLTFLVIYWYSNIEGLFQNMILISILSALLIFANFVFLKNGLRNQYSEEQVKIYEQYLQVVEELMETIRAKQHDFDNHIVSMKMMLEASEKSQETKVQLEGYIADMEDSFQDSNLIKMHNKVIAGFLYSKKKIALQNAIKMEIQLEDYDFNTKLKDYELIEILSILINNAMETQVLNNEITVRFKKDQDFNRIEIENKHPYIGATEINRFFKKGYSTKSSDGRGIGLHKLKSIVKDHHGEIEVYNREFDENFVVFKVSIP